VGGGVGLCASVRVKTQACGCVWGLKHEVRLLVLRVQHTRAASGECCAW